MLIRLKEKAHLTLRHTHTHKKKSISLHYYFMLESGRVPKDYNSST